MHARTPFYLMLGLLIASLGVFLGSAVCAAADWSLGSVESGRPRELIHQPTCWPPEEVEDVRQCDLAGKF